MLINSIGEFLQFHKKSFSVIYIITVNLRKEMEIQTEDPVKGANEMIKRIGSQNLKIHRQSKKKEITY